MIGPVIIDTNLLLLLVVGSAHRSFIGKHKRLRNYTVDDFDILGVLIGEFSEIVMVPHILSEVSSLSRQIGDPARGRIQATLRALVEATVEWPIASILGVQREEFGLLGLTDAVVLHLCSLELGGVAATLLTADQDLADRASSLGYSVLDYNQV